MGILVAIIYGCIQGVTEFLPVSSSGHLKIAHLLGLSPCDEAIDAPFDVLLHLASLLAIVIAFRREILQACRRGPRFFCYLLIAMVPTGIAGILGEPVVLAFGRHWWLIALAYLWTATWLLVAHHRTRPVPAAILTGDVLSAEDLPPLADVTQRRAWLVGLLQIPALLPGVSRSGVTIAAGLVGGMRPATALAFSFLVGLPLIAGAAAKKTLDGGFGILLTRVGIAPLIGAFVTCLLVSLGSIWLLRVTLQGRHLHWFARYCVLLAGVCFALAIWRS